VAITTAASRLGTSAFNDTNIVELRGHWTQVEAQAAIDAIYRQVLGNDYLMAAERLTVPESLLSNRQITVREFVRMVGKSELYKNKFFYPNFQTRAIELNFKHLLGRAPYDEAEIIAHLDLYQHKGYEADIDSYIDSPEYAANFGDGIVPYYRGFSTQIGQKTTGFGHMFQLYRGYANSSRSQSAGSKPCLARELGQNQASAVIPPSHNYADDRPLLTTYESEYTVGTNSPCSYRIEVTGLRTNPDRTTYLVATEQLSDTLQQIAQLGGKVLRVTVN
jgi:phycocyanin-associated rod linker protein